MMESRTNFQERGEDDTGETEIPHPTEDKMMVLFRLHIVCSSLGIIFSPFKAFAFLLRLLSLAIRKTP
jgi:hypothetical protein